MESTFLFTYLFGSPGPMEMLILGIVILILFGNRLPSVMRSLGRGVVEFKKGLQGIDDEPTSPQKPSESEAPKASGS